MTFAARDHSRYTRVAIALHWTIAACIFFNLATGFFMEGLRPAWKGVVVPLHISSGMTVLVLTLLRIVWRLSHAPPPLPADMAAWEKTAAHAAHAIIYFMMLAMPVTGWGIISAHPPNPKGGPMYFGLAHIPPLGPVSNLAAAAQKAAHDNFAQLHSIGGWIFLALLVLHVAAALKHQWFDGGHELQRMGLGRSRADG